MFLAEVPSFLIDTAEALASLGVIFGAAIAASKTSGGKFLWHQLVSKPLGEWQTAQIKAVVDPVEKKLDETASALVSHMGDEIVLRREDAAADAHLRELDDAERERRQSEMDAWRDEVRGDIASLRTDVKETRSSVDGTVGTIHRRLDAALEAMATANPKLMATVVYHSEDDEEDETDDDAV